MPGKWEKPLMKVAREETYEDFIKLTELYNQLSIIDRELFDMFATSSKIVPDAFFVSEEIPENVLDTVEKAKEALFELVHMLWYKYV